MRRALLTLAVWLCASPPASVAADVAAWLNDVRGEYDKGRWLECEQRLRPVIVSDVFGDAAERAAALDLWAEVLVAVNGGTHEEAFAAALKALAYRKEVSRDDAAGRVSSLRTLARALADRADYEGAQKHLDEALRLRSDLPALLDAAELALWRERLDEAQERLDAVRGRLRETTVEVGLVRRLGALHARWLVRRGRYAEARPLLDEELATWKRESPRAPAAAATLHAIGDLAWFEGRLDQARDAYREAVELLRSTVGGRSPAIISIQGRWAIAESEAGDLQRAFALHREVVELAERRLGLDHPETGARINDLGIALELAGDLREAARLYRVALDRDLRGGRRGSDQVATLFHNLAIVSLRTGDARAAMDSEQRALAIWETLYGPEHPFVAHALEGWGDALSATRDSRAALAAYQRALAIREQALGGRHADVLALCARMAELSERLGETEAARRYADRTLESRSTAVLSRSIDRARALIVRSRLRLAAGEAPDVALGEAAQAEMLRVHYLKATVRYLSEPQAIEAASRWPTGRDASVSAALAAGRSETAARAWDVVASTRSLVQDEMARRQRVEPAAPEHEALRHVVDDARRRVAALTYRQPAPASHGAALLETARADLQEAESRLAWAVAGRVEPADAVVVRDLPLPAGSVLVAFVRYTALHRDGERVATEARYAAFVRRVDREAVALIGLGPAARIDASVQRWRRSAADVIGALREAARCEREAARAGAELEALVWRPLRAQFAGSQRIFVVPDGALQLVSFAALPAGERSYVAETGPPLHYLSAERDLANDRGESTNRLMVALGAPAFDASALDIARAEAYAPGPGAPKGVGTAEGHAPRAVRGVGCGDGGAPRFEPLPASFAEVEVASAAWTRAHQEWPVAALWGLTAGEATLRRLSSQSRILHLATHGFVRSSTCVSVPPPSGMIPADPLLLAGVALAGANRHEAGRDDGILTAREIAGLDLGGLEWAVLSGCDTGLGEWRDGEGVLGLRRAFAIAGARTVIMSLWPIEDGEARLFMEELYRARLDSAKDTTASMSAATVAAIGRLRRSLGAAPPALWAPFVAVGDWR